MTTYEQGYEDGTYRRQQVPGMDYREQTVEMANDIGASTVTFWDILEYTKGWADGYSNSQPLDRQ